MIAAISSRPHYAAHLAPILAALPDGLPEDACLVASHADLVAARKQGFERVILAQHGAGQSYGGDPKSDQVAAYPGGDDNGGVGLFLVPNEHSARRWRAAYPEAGVEVVGSPILDTLPAKDPSEPLTVAVTFHWDGRFVPEAGSAFHWFRGAVAELPARFRVIGHRHPRRRDLPAWYRRNRIEFVDDFAEVCRRADVLVADNTSSLFEFASTGRPVVVLNSPRYRTNVDHGLRFWDAAHVGWSVWMPEHLAPAVEGALRDRPLDRQCREDALGIVYAYRTGAARRAADAIEEWLS